MKRYKVLFSYFSIIVVLFFSVSVWAETSAQRNVEATQCTAVSGNHNKRAAPSVPFMPNAGGGMGGFINFPVLPASLWTSVGQTPAPFTVSTFWQPFVDMGSSLRNSFVSLSSGLQNMFFKATMLKYMYKSGVLRLMGRANAMMASYDPEIRAARAAKYQQYASVAAAHNRAGGQRVGNVYVLSDGRDTISAGRTARNIQQSGSGIVHAGGNRK